MPSDPHVARLLASQSTLRGANYDGTQGVFEAYDTKIDFDAVTHAYAALYTVTGDCVATADSDDRWQLPGGAIGDVVWYDALEGILREQCGAAIVDLFPFATFRPSNTSGLRVVAIAIAGFDDAPTDVAGYATVLATTSALAQSLIGEASPRDAGLLAVADAIRIATGFGQP